MSAESRSLPFVLPLVSALLLGPAAAAQEMAVDDIAKGAVVVATRDVTLRDAPPSPGLIYERGQEAGTLRAGERAKVEMVSIFKTALFGQQKWVALRVGNETRWAFAGNVGARSCCFRPAGS